MKLDIHLHCQITPSAAGRSRLSDSIAVHGRYGTLAVSLPDRARTTGSGLVSPDAVIEVERIAILAKGGVKLARTEFSPTRVANRYVFGNNRGSRIWGIASGP